MRDQNDEFFVGYLRMPAGLTRFLQRVAIAAVLLALGAAAVIAARQRDPGDGRWDYGKTSTFVGRVTMKPYAMLELHDGAGAMVLVGVGKRSADTAGTADGRTVRIRGTVLRRANLRMLEVEGEIEPVVAPYSAIDVSVDAAPVTFRGEIIDPKCFAGAMKPGDGKAHKACAALCLRGGIPPALHTRAADGTDRIYLLVNSDGAPITGPQLDRVIAQIGEDVNLIGRIVALGRMRLLAVDPGTIRRRAP